MVMKKATGDDSSGRVPGRASRPSRSWDDNGGGLQYVSWKSVRPFRVFASKGIHRRKGDFRDGPGAHTTWWRDRGWPAPPYGAAALWPPSVSPLDFVFVLGK
jgi:hypothetical protein